MPLIMFTFLHSTLIWWTCFKLQIRFDNLTFMIDLSIYGTKRFEFLRLYRFVTQKDTVIVWLTQQLTTKNDNSINWSYSFYFF